MAVYLNPPSPATKENWLMEHGQPTPKPSWVDRPEGTFPVCLIINGIFVNANVAHNVKEFKYLYRNDGKPRHWFYVPVEKLLGASNLREHLPKDSPLLADEKGSEGS